MNTKLPIYKLAIGNNEDEDVDYIALVESPAIQRNFLAFNQQFLNPSEGEAKEDFIPRCISYVINEGKENEQAVAICNSLWEQKFNKNLFAIQNEEQKIVSGPLMIADLPIYRNDEQGEYYVVFTAPEIKRIVQRFFKNGYQANVNLEHNTKVDGVYMFESFIIEREKGINPPKGYEDLPDGSWWGSFKVDNEKIWEEVKDGTFKGFSIEGMFKYELVPDKDQQTMNKIIEILEQIEH